MNSMNYEFLIHNTIFPQTFSGSRHLFLISFSSFLLFVNTRMGSDKNIFNKQIAGQDSQQMINLNYLR